VVMDGFQFEVATLRSDSNSSDGRRPDSVSFTTSLEEDAKRRDFTMNAMFYDPITHLHYDFFTGKMDIEDKLITCVGEPSQRFEEDKLRMMRAIRFSCQLDFDIEEYTWMGICNNADKILEVSWERIKMELDKILLSKRAGMGIRLLSFCGILKYILPEVDILRETEQSKRWHSEGNSFLHTLDALERVKEESNDLDVLWGTLLHDIGKATTSEEIDGIIKHTHHASVGAEMTREVMNRFKSSTEHKEAVIGIVKDHMRIKQADKMKKSSLRRLIAEPHYEKVKLVSWSDSKASIPADPEDGKHKFDWFIHLNNVEEELQNEVSLPDPIIKGRDLIMEGLIPSKDFGEILNQLMDLQLEGVITSKEEGIKIMKEIINERRNS
jgi:putative nucleotidyltransferase with HDIG domain